MLTSRDPSVIERFLSDESNAFRASPDSVTAILFPETEQDIVDAVKSAAAKGERITVSGGGTGITGSRVPLSGGTVISLEKMLRCRTRDGCTGLVREGAAGPVRVMLDERKQTAHVAPGVSISELQSILPRNLIYPPDPTETSAFLGGTVATNASGARCFHYGPTRAWISGLRVVLPDGETADISRGECFADAEGKLEFRSLGGRQYSLRIPKYAMPEVKNAAGLYSMPGMDLIDLFIGSEGILGIVSEISMKLIPVLREPVSVLAFFYRYSDAMGYADALRSMKQRGILSVEYFDDNSLDFIRPQFPELDLGLEAAVMSEVKAESMDLLAETSELLARFNAAEDWCAATADDRRDMKEFRHSLPDAVNLYLKQHDSYKIGTDFVVPSGKFPEMMAKYREAGEGFRAKFPRPGVHYVLFGHIGDCHLHFNFITANGAERDFAKELYLGLAKAAVSMGGTVSGEHGVGKKALAVGGKTVPYLELMYGREGLEEIARVKRVLDPEGLLNPGNMLGPGWTDPGKRP